MILKACLAIGKCWNIIALAMGIKPGIKLLYSVRQVGVNSKTYNTPDFLNYKEEK